MDMHLPKTCRGLASAAVPLIDVPVVIEGISKYPALSHICTQLAVRCEAKEWSDGDEACTTAVARASKTIMDFTHEKFYEGYWRDVPVVWRYMYAWSSLVHAAALAGTQPAAALRVCDLGLMMGAPLPSELLSKCAAHLHALIDNENADKKVCTTAVSDIEEADHRSKRARVEDVRDSVTALPVLTYPVGRIREPGMMEFREKYFMTKEPVILEHCMTHWPAMERWHDLNYLKVCWFTWSAALSAL